MSAQVGVYGRDASDGQKRVRTLTLSAGQTSKGIDGVIAVIDGEPHEVDQAYAFLQMSFGASGGDQPVTSDMEGTRVEHVLNQLERGRTSIAMALWSGTTVVVACRGGGRVYIFRADRASSRGDETVKSDSGGIAQVGQFAVSRGDALILVDSAVARHVRDSEIQQEGRGGFSDAFTEQDAAVWLTALALRSTDSAGVVVAHFGKGGGRIRAVPKVSLPSLPPVQVGWPRARLRLPVISNRVKVVLVSALGCAFVLGGTASLLRLGSQLTAASSTVKKAATRAQLSARPIHVHSVPATSALKAGSQSLQSWKFPALPNAPRGKVLLTLYNPTKTTVTREVRTFSSGGVRVRTERIFGGQTVSVVLPSSEARDSRGNVSTLYVQTSKPIVPLGVVVGQ
jgi:hypothetical protein